MKARVRTSAVVVHNEGILCFFAVDPTSGREYHFLPGGEIEADETAPAAAARETLEETGYQVRIDPSSAIEAEYEFHWDGEDYLSFTIFYRGYLTSPFQEPQKTDDAAYNQGARWVPVGEIKRFFGYSPEIEKAVRELALD